jgi:hypothetical protein
MRRLLALFVGLFLAASAFAQADWTFMVYLNADNNLEDAGIADFLEMASVGSDANLNIVLYFDRIPGYDTSYGDWTDTRRGIVMPGDTPTASWGESIGEKNMGDGATLTEFIDWGTTNYPAARYALILWNHGGGWRTPAALLAAAKAAKTPAEKEAVLADIRAQLPSVAVGDADDPAAALAAEVDKRVKAICWDDTSGGDCLYTKEMQLAIDAAADPMTLIGFDACLMNMIEVAYQIRNTGAEVMVGSEEVEPGDGWPYNTLLADLKADTTVTAAQLGTYIADRYYESYGDGTQSVVDLLGYDNLAFAVDNLATTMIDSWDVEENVRDAAQDVLDELDLVILHNRNGAAYPGARGVSINFPVNGADADYTAANIDFAGDTAWPAFLDAYEAEMGGSWIATARNASQSFYDANFIDLYDFCDRLVNYIPAVPGYVETQEASSGFIGGGVAQDWQDDDECWSYTLPFAFPFYGGDRTSVNVCSNGYLDFTDAVADKDNSSAALIAATRIAPLWQDLDTTTGNIYIHQPSADSVCIRWEAVKWDTLAAVNVEVVLYEDGRIRFNYGGGNADLNPTVGLSYGDGAQYDLSANYNRAFVLTNARTLLFTPRFTTPTLTYVPTVFDEVLANDGAIGNSVTISLGGETFVTDVVSGGHVTASNVPAGLTPVFTRNGDTRITFSLAGNAVSHRNADDVADLTVTFADAAFAGGDAAAVADSTRSNLQIDFDDIYYAVHFTVSPNGSGTIQGGAATQSVVEGGSTAAVTAAPVVGRHFTGWTGDIPPGQENDNPLTINNVLADLDIVANFAINTYTLTFTAGPNGTVDGVAVVTQTVNHGATSVGVTAIPDPDCLFIGWTGDYVGSNNPLVFTSVTAGRTVTANFLETAGLVHLTVGSAFTVTAGEAGLLEFTRKPKLWTVYVDPVKDPWRVKPGKASASVLGKVSSAAPTTQVRAEWKKKLCLFSRKYFQGEQKIGTPVALWLANHAIEPLLVDQWIGTKEPSGIVLKTYRQDLFVGPKITGAVDNGNGTMTLSGNWFGTKAPKVWREYIDAKKNVAKQQKLKVLPPANPAIVDAKGKMAFMNAADGVSQVIVEIPAAIPPGATDTLVLDNGVGLAIVADPS